MTIRHVKRRLSAAIDALGKTQPDHWLVRTGKTRMWRVSIAEARKWAAKLVEDGDMPEGFLEDGSEDAVRLLEARTRGRKDDPIAEAIASLDARLGEMERRLDEFTAAYDAAQTKPQN